MVVVEADHPVEEAVDVALDQAGSHSLKQAVDGESLRGQCVRSQCVGDVAEVVSHGRMPAPNRGESDGDQLGAFGLNAKHHHGEARCKFGLGDSRSKFGGGGLGRLRRATPIEASAVSKKNLQLAVGFQRGASTARQIR